MAPDSDIKLELSSRRQSAAIRCRCSASIRPRRCHHSRSAHTKNGSEQSACEGKFWLDGNAILCAVPIAAPNDGSCVADDR
jgi:hypothetical protein